jgi:predicted NUDIX family NTP pyrophosphohydrolase
MKISAGLLVYRIRDGYLQIFLIHPGGPFWDKKDAASWSIPKGEVDDQEESLNAARREFLEETGFHAPGPFIKLKPVKQSSHKTVEAWAMEGDYDPLKMHSNSFSMEWPPKSGQMQSFPEADRAEWFTITEARQKIFKGQVPLLDQLEELLKDRLSAGS